MSNSGSKSRKKLKLNQIETKDRLSNLSDCVLIRILSFLDIKRAIRTCILSSRWKILWKLLPELTFNSEYFRNCKSFTEFVSRVLSLRDASVSLQALDFKHASQTDKLEHHTLNMIVKYAISHNVQWLGISVLSDIAQIPDSVFSCQTLTHLKLAIYHHRVVRGFHCEVHHGVHRGVNCGVYMKRFPESFDLPALTSLQLENFKFCSGDKDRAKPFSTFNKLNSLVISNCTVSGAKTLSISSATLVNLTLNNQFSNSYITELCTPSLCTFTFTGTPYQTLSGTNVSSLKHVEIYATVTSNQKKSSLYLFNWLLEFPNINSLTVSASTLQVLYLIPDLLKTNHPSLTNLESLKVKIEPLSYRLRMALCHAMLKKVKSKKEAARLRIAFTKGSEPSSPIPAGMMDFLLQNSPSAKVDFIDCSKQPRRLAHL